jgi:hypothetical protein
MITCEKCGMESSDEIEFCTSCGTRFCAELHYLLKDGGLEAYFGVFRQNHILAPDEVALLEDANFDELGIAAIGDRTRLRKIIQGLRGVDVEECASPQDSSITPAPQEPAPLRPPAIQTTNPPIPAQKSRTTYILLAVLLGSFGIHNFYAGRTGMAVAQLLVSLLSAFTLSIVTWIWAVIEAATIKVDGRSVPFK